MNSPFSSRCTPTIIHINRLNISIYAFELRTRQGKIETVKTTKPFPAFTTANQDDSLLIYWEPGPNVATALDPTFDIALP